MRLFLLFLLLACGWTGLPGGQAAMTHPGGLNAQGCHNNRKTGGYHCHRGPAASPDRAKSLSLSSGREFANCAQARAAGAARVRAGDPGYGRHLDRDGDGVGCE
ncbi:MAG: excalibur calcium-binding domain-containing protein [Sphingomicrobium sp.]